MPRTFLQANSSLSLVNSLIYLLWKALLSTRKHPTQAGILCHQGCFTLLPFHPYLSGALIKILPSEFFRTLLKMPQSQIYGHPESCGVHLIQSALLGPSSVLLICTVAISQTELSLCAESLWAALGLKLQKLELNSLALLNEIGLSSPQELCLGDTCTHNAVILPF